MKFLKFQLHTYQDTLLYFSGFTFCNEITYPLINQSIITNGKTWSFYLYQLNTMRFFKSENAENIPVAPNNICWATKTTELFHEIKDNRIVGKKSVACILSLQVI